MNDGDLITETRPIREIERVVVQVDNVISELVVHQGERESLTITGPEDLVSRLVTEVRDGKLIVSLNGTWSQRLRRALTTSLTRQMVHYDLEVRQLRELELCGFTHAEIPQLRSDEFSLHLWGGGNATVGHLVADSLEVSLRGSTRLEVSGQVSRQQATLEGMGHYSAARLKSRSASLRLCGWGKATVWATEMLQISTHGMGIVEYYGSPRLHGNGSPMAQITRMGDAPSTATAAWAAG